MPPAMIAVATTGPLPTTTSLSVCRICEEFSKKILNVCRIFLMCAEYFFFGCDVGGGDDGGGCWVVPLSKREAMGGGSRRMLRAVAVLCVCVYVCVCVCVC